MAESKQRKRLLYLRELLLKETDKDHFMTIEEIARRLQVDRRTVEDDIEVLEESIGVERKPPEVVLCCYRA